MKLLTENQNINKLSYGFAFLFMTIGAILQYITPYFNQLGKEDIGFKVLTLLYFSIFIGNSFAPYFIQKYGTRKMILITAITYIISISSIIVNNIFIIYIGTILLGFSGAILWNSQNIYLIKVSKKNDIGINSGFFVAIYSIGCALGIVMLGYLVEIFSYKISFLIMLFFSFIGLYFFTKLDCIEDKYIKKQKTKSLYSIRSVTLLKSVLISSYIQSILFGVATSLIPLHIQLITKSSIIVGVLSALFFTLPLFISPYVGKYSDVYGRGNMIILGLLASLTGLIIFNFSTSVQELTIGILFISISQSILFPMMIAFQRDISTKENQLLITNFFMFFKYIGLVTGVIIGGIFGIKLSYMIIIFLIIVIWLFSFNTLKNTKLLKNKILDEM